MHDDEPFVGRIRAELRRDVADLRPPADLLSVLNARHRGRVIGGRVVQVCLSGVAIVVVAVLAFAMGGEVANQSPAAPATPASTQIGERIRAAIDGAKGSILHLQGSDRTEQTLESWTLASTGRTRALLFTQGELELDKVEEQRPGDRDDVETIDFRRRVVTVADSEWVQQRTFVSVSHAFQNGYDLAAQLAGSVTYTDGRVRTIGDRQVYAVVAIQDGDRVSELLVDSRTYLPIRYNDEYGALLYFEWLPPTADNLGLLNHSIPDGFARG